MDQLKIGSFFYFIPMFGFIFACSGFIRALQLKGSLSKNRMKKIRRILTPITIAVLVLCTLGVILLTLLVTY